jgi:hypothetical protein
VSGETDVGGRWGHDLVPSIAEPGTKDLSETGLVGVLSDDPVDQGFCVLCDPSLDVERCKGEKPVDQSAAEDRLLEWGHGRHCHSETKTH